jgi:hypothetical protein
LIAIIASQKEGKNCFEGADDHRAGLAIIILVIVPTKDREQLNATAILSLLDPLSPPPEQAAPPAKSSLRLT